MSAIANNVYPILSNLAVYYSLPNQDPVVYQKASIWRPPQWKQSAQTIITIPASSPNIRATTTSAATMYVFDAVLKVSHLNEVKLTEYPVQNGAPISDHAMIMPIHVTLEIAMSDAQDSFQQPSPWGSNSGKGVAAFQTMLGLLQDRVLVTLTTRLFTYRNMMLISQTSDDNYLTQFGLKAVLNFREVFLATVTSSIGTSTGGGTAASAQGYSYDLLGTGGGNKSALPDVNLSTPNGQTGTSNVPTNVLTNNQLSPAAAKALGYGTTVPGQTTPDGTSYSSTPISALPQSPN